MKFKVGDVVMLIGCDDFMPPIGSVGVVTGWSYQGGLDYDVLFADHPCPVAEPEWCIPPYWLMKVEPPKQTEQPKEKTCETY
jgi:hypothetical protein